LYKKVKQLENDIQLWENNIGFFAKSKNAEDLIKDVKIKIDKAREDMSMLIEKIKLIDSKS
jgi:putative ubiquitin-RnfH superfamily antitoxin RatB of RatAB toxin-antitoxin module